MGEFSNCDDDDLLAALDLEAAILQNNGPVMAAVGGGAAATSSSSPKAQSGHPNPAKACTIAFDTETNDWLDCNEETRDDNVGRVVQLGWVCYGADRSVLSRTCRILKPDGYVIAEKAAKYHGINTMRANLEGADGSTVLREFMSAIEDASDDCVLVAHKIQFDVNALLNEVVKREVSEQENALRLLTEKMKRCDMHSLRYLETVDVAEYWSTKYGLSLSKMFQLTCPKHENREALLSRAHDGISNAEMAGAIYFSLCNCGAYSHITDRLAKKSRPSCGDSRLVTPQRIMGEFSDSMTTTMP